MLVDAIATANDPQLAYLLSFEGVEGLELEQNVRIVEEGERSHAHVGAEGLHRVSLSPLKPFRRFAAEIAGRPGSPLSAEIIERALAFSHLASLLHLDAIVSPARQAFGPQDAGLLRVPMLTVPEALAVVGAHVRQRDEVPLGGTPPMTQSRTEVYPLTARVIVPSGQEWWSSCVRYQGSEREEVLGLGEAVFKRLAQALRGRDGAHEALRRGDGRSAILDSLYHLDVVLTSSVASLDALARLAHKVFDVEDSSFDAGWQRPKWIGRLRNKAPSLADLITGRTKAQLDILTSMRNSIHAIPLDEFLYVERGGHSRTVEHRAMLSAELGTRILSVGQDAGSPEDYGLFLSGPGTPYLNVGLFAERVLTWSIGIVGLLLAELLTFQQFPATGPPSFSRLDLREREACAALAQVGQYPVRTDVSGIPARPSLHQSVMGSLHRAQQKVGQ
ncbi:MAG: hypothetical protein ACR2MC_10845 [Actinomycetota bacterium]